MSPQPSAELLALRAKFAPPYTDLATALAAIEALVDVVSSCLPAAAVDVRELGDAGADFGMIDQTTSPGDTPAHRATRRFARMLVDRLLTEPADVVFYPLVPDDALDYEAEEAAADASNLALVIDDFNRQLTAHGLRYEVSSAARAGRLERLELVPLPAHPSKPLRDEVAPS